MNLRRVGAKREELVASCIVAEKGGRREKDNGGGQFSKFSSDHFK